ncbi:uncharacterized protein LOC132786186 [Drosophila nasuta]|uniref:uncharacterized protein LOC132786186 n=1 Tax=Drosophila nasuta TaxID=42062 RepID=UPI00295E5C9E|nr:uncharacterized protein LOC132786186 [Drosophila nasuta]
MRCNAILKTTLEHKEFQEQIISVLKYKIQIFKDELYNLIHAIEWAKTNTINSIILSELEISKIEQILENEKIMFVNVEELLEFAKLKIASNGKEMLYMVSIPLLGNQLCTAMKIKPTKKDNVINVIKYENIIKCNNALYAQKNDCESHNDKIICHRDNIIDLSNVTCITPLLNHSRPYCNTVNSQHVPDHEEILTGTILLNDYTGSIQIDQDEVDLKGSYLIQFENSTIRIGDDEYEAGEARYAEAIPPLFQMMAEKTKAEEVLSLQVLGELNINNTRRLDTLRTNNFKANSISFALSGILVITFTILAILVWKLKSTPRAEKTTEIQKGETPSNGTQKRFYIASEDVRV